MSAKINLTYILMSVNLFNFSKGGGGIASSAFILFFYLYWYSYILIVYLFVTQLPSLERWALLPFGVLFCQLSMLISDSRFDLVWFRLSCDHGWIRSGSVNVRKQQQPACCFSEPVIF